MKFKYFVQVSGLFNVSLIYQSPRKSKWCLTDVGGGACKIMPTRVTKLDLGQEIDVAEFSNERRYNNEHESNKRSPLMPVDFFLSALQAK